MKKRIKRKEEETFTDVLQAVYRVDNEDVFMLCGSLDGAFSMSHCSFWRPSFVNDKLEGIWKEVVVAS